MRGTSTDGALFLQKESKPFAVHSEHLADRLTHSIYVDFDVMEFEKFLRRRTPSEVVIEEVLR